MRSLAGGRATRGLRVPIVFGERARFPLPGVILVRVTSLWGLLRFLDLQTWLLAGPESTAILQRGTTSSLPIDAIGSGSIDWHGHRLWVASTRLLTVPTWLISCAPEHAASLQTTLDAQQMPTADAHR